LAFRLFRKKRPRVLLIGTGLAFVASGVDSLECGLIMLAVSTFAAAAVNLLASLFIMRHPLRTDVILFFINAAIAAITSYSLFQAGKDKIPYAWAGICVMYMIAPFIKIYIARRKERKSAQEEIERVSG
jgi:uncharacterized membrane-anchored protein YitT (DUF2179 family)